jgi:hypothetical protein
LKVLDSSNTISISNTLTQQNTQAQSVALSFQESQGTTIYGVPSDFAPVNHDYDEIVIWLNPALLFSKVTKVNGAQSVVWNGYGFDTNAAATPLIIKVPLGELNGDLPMEPQYAGLLSRAWAVNQDWATLGMTPSLTTADYLDIAKYDPFADRNYGKNTLGAVPPTTTGDDRYELSRCSGSGTLQYTQAILGKSPDTTTCSLTYQVSNTSSSDSSTTHSTTVATDVNNKFGFSLWSVTIDLKDSKTVTYTSEQSTSLTNTSATAASFILRGPVCTVNASGNACSPAYGVSYDQPTLFQVYEDKLYGTFMFAPINYYNHM